MIKFGSKQLIPIATALVGVVFAAVGFFQLGFWDKEPQPGFFPTIMAVVLVISSIAAFFQTIQEDKEEAEAIEAAEARGETVEKKPRYNKNELSVIIGGAAIIVGSAIIGFIPSVFLFVFIWLKFVEKGTPWKDLIIIELICAAIVIGVFAVWLQVQFPWGLFEYLM